MNSLLEAALQYAARGWRVIPLHSIRNGACSCRERGNCSKPGKHPRIKTGKGHSQFASTDPSQVEAWWQKWPDANVGAASGRVSGFCVIDVDGPEGMAELRSTVASLGTLPRTLVGVSGRASGGAHLYFALTEPCKSDSGDGLDIRADGGLVVLPPSLHLSGNRYRWLEQRPLAPMPEPWREWFNAGTAPDPLKLGDRPTWLGAAGSVLSTGLRDTLDDQPLPEPEDVLAALRLIPNKDLGWDAWKAIVMAVWAATAGSDAGLFAADLYSQKSRKKYSREGVERCWAEITRSPPDRIGFGSLVFEARKIEPGWQPPSKARTVVPEEMKAFDPFEHKEEPKENPAGININGHGTNGHHALPEALTKETSGNPLIKLNQKHAVIADIGGKCLVLSWVNSKVDESVKIPSFQTFKSFQERYANQYVAIKSVKNGEEVDDPKQLGGYWLKWTGRRSFEGIDLVPGGAPVLAGDTLNLWSGFAVEPAAGSWQLMKHHIFHVLASGDRASAEYIFRFAAWCVQNPGRRAEVALVFRGDKGSGKGTFANALKRLFGEHGLQIFNSKHLVGSFNGHLRNCLLLFADEAFWAGDKQGESVLKGMLTEPTLMIEQKGVDAMPWHNRLHVIMAANSEWVVPASHNERRYAIFDVSDSQIGNRRYFDALHKEIANGGLGAMLYDLQGAPLGEWHPREIVRTDALQRQKERSLDPRHDWWLDVLQGGCLPFLADRVISAAHLLGLLRDNGGRAREVTPTALGRMLRDFGAVRLHREKGSFWQIPELNIARNNWERKFGKWPWEDNSGKWR